MRRTLRLRYAAILFGVVFTFGAGSALAGVETLRVSAFVPPRSVVVSKVLKPWMKKVEEAAGGQLKLVGYWGGALGSNPKKQYDLVRDGVTDVVWFLPGYTPGQFPDMGITELPFLVHDSKEGSEAIWRMYKRGLIGGLKQTHVITVFTTEAAVFHSKHPVKTLADMKGMKVRAGSASQSAFIRYVGATPIGLTVSEMTQAMSRGVVDGGIFTPGGALIFRVYKIARYHYWAPLGAPSMAIVMNKSKWNGLSATAKAAINKYSGRYLERMAGKAYDAFAAHARKVMEKTGTIVDPTKSEVATFQRDAKPLYDKWIAHNKDGAKKFNALVQILADIRAGK